jgi:hypothetical protein
MGTLDMTHFSPVLAPAPVIYFVGIIMITQDCD